MSLTIEELKILIQTDEHRQLELKKTTGELKEGRHAYCLRLFEHRRRLAFLWCCPNIFEDSGAASY